MREKNYIPSLAALAVWRPTRAMRHLAERLEWPSGAMTISFIYFQLITSAGRQEQANSGASARSDD